MTNSTASRSRSSTPLRASALNLNEALEQCWAAASSPHCLSNQLQSPQPPASAQSHSWGNHFGRRRSSNTITTSTSCLDPAHEAPQRRRKSLFYKRPRSKQQTTSLAQDTEQTLQTQFVDPFARPPQPNFGDTTPFKSATQAGAPVSDDAASFSKNRSSHRLSTQQQQNKHALDRVSDLVCLSVQRQMRVPQCQVGASSPTFLTPSPTLCDSYFYPVEAPPSPTGLLDGVNRRCSSIAFPTEARVVSGLLLATGCEVETWLPASQAPSLITRHNQILLPSSMKRLPSRTLDNDTHKRSSASLRAQIGHDLEAKPFSHLVPKFNSALQHPSEWSVFEDSRASLPPPPPLRPSRNPLHSRSKSMGAVMATATQRKDGKNQASPSSPSPPLPSMRLPSSPSPPSPPSMASVNGLVASCDLTPVHFPLHSSPSSGHHRRDGHVDGCDSGTSSSSPHDAPFHTPTFGSSKWTMLPMC